MRIRAVLLLSIFFLSCAEPVLNKNKFAILGTYLEVISSDREAAGIALQEFQRLDSVFSRYDASSELHRLNNNPEKKVYVSEELAKMVIQAKKYFNLTEGAFDVTRGKLYSFWKEWGKNKDNQELPSKQKIKELKDIGGFSGVEIDTKQKTILISQGVNFDFSGVAKGYIVDKAVEKLKEAGINSALINAGGDIYCLGKNRGKPWQVGIRSPSGKIVKTIEVINRAVATSGNYQQLYKKAGKKYSHLIDPRSGYPVEQKLLGVTVVADKCWQADILATAFFINGEEFTREFIRENPSIEAYFITEDEIITF